MSTYLGSSRLLSLGLRLFLILVVVWAVIGCMYLLQYWTILNAGGLGVLAAVILLILTAVLSAIGIFSKYSARQNISLVIVSILFVLYAFELVHYSLNYYPGFPDLAPPLKFDKQFVYKAAQEELVMDARSKVEVIRDLRLREKAVYPAFLVTNRSAWESNLELYKKRPLPLGSISNSIIVHCNESGKWSIYNSDEKGFNNPIGHWGLDSYKALLLGDSYVHGACVDPGEDLGSWIRAEYKEIINLGQRGNGPLLQLAGLKEYGRHLRPEFVFWVYTENNDLSNLVSESQSDFLKKYMRDDFTQNLIARQPDIDDFIDIYTEYNYKLAKKMASPNLFVHIQYILSLRSTRKLTGFEMSGVHSASDEWAIFKRVTSSQDVGVLPSEVPKKVPITASRVLSLYLQWHEQLNNYRAILSKAKKETEAWGGKLVFVFIINNGRYVWPDMKRWALKDEMINLVRTLDIPIIDTAELIMSHNHKQYYPPKGGHFNGEGYKVIADRIVEYMRRSSKL